MQLKKNTHMLVAVILAAWAVALLPAKAYAVSPDSQTTSCYMIADETFEGWDGCSDSEISILFFPMDFAEDLGVSSRNKGLFLHTGRSEIDGFLACFSERQLLEMGAFKRTSASLNGTVIYMPAIRLYDNEYYTKTVIPKIFFLTSDKKAVAMLNPFNGEEIRLEGIDYIKFRNTVPLPVPPPL